MSAATQSTLAASSSTIGNKRMEIQTITCASGDTVTSNMARPEHISGPAITAFSIVGNVITLTLSGSVTAQRYLIIGT